MPGHRSREPRSPLRTLAVNGAHLGAASAFALAQPLFDLLGKNADFFAVRGSTRWDIVLFALAVVFVPPAGLLAIEVLAGLAARPLQQALHLVFLAGLTGVAAIHFLKRTTDLGSTGGLIVLAALLGIALAVLYWRLPPVRSFLSVLSPAPLVFLVLFLFISPVSELTLAADTEVEVANVGRHAPVVMIVFDEFPVTDLLDEAGQIDAGRYPNFAKLAQSSTWFRNTTTVSFGTNRAVPAVLTGNYPQPGHPPIFSGHPRNIFTLLGADYRMNVFEHITHLCPEELCKNSFGGTPAALEPVSLYSDVGIVYLHMIAPPRLEATLPPVTTQWMNFGRDTDETADLIEKALQAEEAKETKQGDAKEGKKKPRQDAKRSFYDGRAQQFQLFVRSLKPSRRPSLNVLHVLLPHLRWVYFPSGSQSSAPIRRFSTESFHDPFFTVQDYQRHLLQVGFVDRLIGQLLARLHETGLYDRSLVVVTADHGVGFHPGEPRRGATKANLQDLAFVPLFIKKPGQQEGSVVDYHVRTTDIVPTIADILDVRIPWRVDGRTALEDPKHELVTISNIVRLSEPELAVADLEVPYDDLLKAKEEALRRKLDLFGAGLLDRIFANGPYRDLLGRPVSTLPVAGSSSDRVEIDDEATRKLLENLSADRPFVPSPIVGRVEGAGAQDGRMIAVAVNGSIAAVARTYGDGASWFSALAPESAFQTGRNEVDFFWVDGTAGSFSLTQLTE